MPDPKPASAGRARKGRGLRSVFPGYYPPGPEELEAFVTEGLIVLDTNALLDFYRFTDDARDEYREALTLVGDRLWIPHRAGQEFHDRRATVIRSRRADREDFEKAFEKALDTVTEVVLNYAARRGLSGDAAMFTGLVDGLKRQVTEQFDAADDVVDSIDPDASPDDDPILAIIEELTQGRIGAAFPTEDMPGKVRTGEQRIAGYVPPGYLDAKKGERAVGDYLLWEQTIQKAKDKKMRVLLICNEHKEDWTRRDGNYYGPRPELVKEMADRAGQPFHLVDVRTFLALAKEHLAAEVSEATVDEATRLSNEGDARISLLEAINARVPVQGEGFQRLAAELRRQNEAFVTPELRAVMFDLTSQSLSQLDSVGRDLRNRALTDISFAATHSRRRKLLDGETDAPRSDDESQPEH